MRNLLDYAHTPLSNQIMQLAPRAKPAAASAAPRADAFREPYSGLRIRNPLLSRNEVDALTAGRTCCCAAAKASAAGDSADVVGVVAGAATERTDKNGAPFLVWPSDLAAARAL